MSRFALRIVFFAAAWLAVLSLPAGAERPPTAARPPEETQRLGKAIEEVLDSPDYRWRLPREKKESDRALLELELSFMDRIQNALGKAFRTLMRWIDRLFSRKHGEGSEALDLSPRPLYFIAAAIVASILAIMVYRAWRRRGQRGAVQAAVPVAEVQPDPLAESTTADQLPMDRWMVLARELSAQGQYRGAMRALFFACLTHLVREGCLTFAKHKSNREYQRELTRRAHDLPSLVALFRESTGLLECVWYGSAAATEERYAAFSENAAAILAGGVRPAAAPERAGGPA